jgi:hypothetical protein
LGGGGDECGRDPKKRKHSRPAEKDLRA